MTREEAKHFWPIIKAYSEGKTIEYLLSEGRWADVTEDFLFDNSHERYRIKQEPSYRPFTSKDECWEEMRKHQPFGWFRHKKEGLYEPMRIDISEDTSFKSLFNTYTFADGTPFGILEN